MKVKSLLVLAFVGYSAGTFAASLPDATTFNRLLSDESANHSAIPGGEVLASAGSPGDSMDDGSAGSGSSSNSSTSDGSGSSDTGTGDDDY